MIAPLLLGAAALVPHPLGGGAVARPTLRPRATKAPPHVLMGAPPGDLKAKVDAMQLLINTQWVMIPLGSLFFVNLFKGIGGSGWEQRYNGGRGNGLGGGFFDNWQRYRNGGAGAFRGGGGGRPGYGYGQPFTTGQGGYSGSSPYAPRGGGRGQGMQEGWRTAPEVFYYGLENLAIDPFGWFFGDRSPLYSERGGGGYGGYGGGRPRDYVTNYVTQRGDSSNDRYSAPGIYSPPRDYVTRRGGAYGSPRYGSRYENEWSTDQTAFSRRRGQYADQRYTDDQFADRYRERQYTDRGRSYQRRMGGRVVPTSGTTGQPLGSPLSAGAQQRRQQWLNGPPPV